MVPLFIPRSVAPADPGLRPAFDRPVFDRLVSERTPSDPAPAEPRDADAVFRAVSDPTRRAILELLRTDERTAGDLAAPFSMSRPAISQHLKVLKDAELVSVRSEGRGRVYRLNPLPLHALFDWTALFEGTLDMLRRAGRLRRRP
jgi:DNA-binding transcriptional ArsR family regulator